MSHSEHGRVGERRAVDAVDLIGVRLLLGRLLRWSPAIVVAAALGWLVGGQVPDLGQPNRAVVPVALTEQVVWPFYDTVVARQTTLLEPATDAAAASTGIDAGRIVLVGTTDTNALMWIEVDAGTEEHALALADAVAAALVDENLAEQRRELQSALDAADELAVLQQQRVDDLTQEEATLRASGDSNAADVVLGALATAERELESLRLEVVRTRAALDGVQPRLEVVAPATLARDRSDDLSSRLVVATLFALLAVLGTNAADVAWRRIRSASEVRGLFPGVPVLDEPGRRRILAAETASVLVQLAARERISVLTVGAGVDQRIDDALTDLDADIQVIDAVPGAVIPTDTAVVVVVGAKAVRRRELEVLADELTTLGVSPRSVLVTRR